MQSGQLTDGESIHAEMWQFKEGWKKQHPSA
jgi:hypothetical protein